MLHTISTTPPHKKEKRKGKTERRKKGKRKSRKKRKKKNERAHRLAHMPMYFEVVRIKPSPK